MRYELTEPADRDIEGIIRDTMRMFGPRQVQVYGRLLDRGMEMVAEDPDRPGSLDRSEIVPGVRLLHLEIAAGRRGGAAHCLYYMKGQLSDGTVGTIILRVLHERMEPRNRVIRGLRIGRKDTSDEPEDPGSSYGA